MKQKLMPTLMLGASALTLACHSGTPRPASGTMSPANQEEVIVVPPAPPSSARHSSATAPILDCTDVPEADPSGLGYDCPATQLAECQRECVAGKAQACAGLATARLRKQPVDAALLTSQLQLLCDAQEAIACRCLGQLYVTGEGRPQSDELAAGAYASACAAGDGVACAFLAFMLSKGRGVPLDRPQAFELLRSHCEQGVAAACNNLGYWYVQGDFVEQDYARAFELFMFACRKGQVNACDSVGEAYENGWHVTQNLERAETCYLLGCKYWNGGASCESAARVRSRMATTTAPSGAP